MGRQRSRVQLAVGIAVAVAAAAGAAPAQQAAPPAGAAVGDMAPAFSGRGATRHGRIADPIQLSDYNGKTIVLAFFFRARTTG